MTDVAERPSPTALAGAPADQRALPLLGRRAQELTRHQGSPRSCMDRRAGVARRVDALHRRRQRPHSARARPGCPLRRRSGSPSTPSSSSGSPRSGACMARASATSCSRICARSSSPPRSRRCPSCSCAGSCPTRPHLWPQGIRAWAFAAAYLAAGRVALHWSRAQAYRHGESFRPTLIIGAGKVGRLAASRLLSQPQLGLKPIGFLDKEPLLAEDDSLPLPVLGASWDLDRIVEQYGVEQVVDHVLPRAPRGAAPAREALRGARRPGGVRAAAVREDDEPADRRALRRPAAHLGPLAESEGPPVRGQVRGRSRSSRSACCCSHCP